MTEPSERPILFSAPMVRAILADRKTQTRRLLTVPWKGRARALPYEPYYCDRGGELWECIDEPQKVDERWGPYRVGQRGWVRETWAPIFTVIRRHDLLVDVAYRADGETPNPDGARRVTLQTGRESEQAERFLKRGAWVPGIHMPRWASRLALEVTEVRVQRLQEISDEDAVAEGVMAEREAAEARGATLTDDIPDPRRRFAKLWDSINGKREGASWAANPWVWAITFKRLEAP